MKFNKTNVTKILIAIQDNDGIQLACNAIATRAIRKMGLENLHQKLTGNSKESYKRVIYRQKG